MVANRRAVLIVQDHDGTKDTLRRLLKDDGWEVQEAHGVRDGLPLLKECPDCIVLDLMPDGSGEAILRCLRESGMETRVVVTSATGDEGRLEAVARAYRPHAIVGRPIEFNGFLRACGGSPPG